MRLKQCIRGYAEAVRGYVLKKPSMGASFSGIQPRDLLKRLKKRCISALVHKVLQVHKIVR